MASYAIHSHQQNLSSSLSLSSMFITSFIIFSYNRTMELASTWLQDSHHHHHFSFLTPITIYSTAAAFILTAIIVIAKSKAATAISSSSCKCDTCQSYVESRWSRDFTNLCDWYTHLLRNSPAKTIHIHVLNNTITANPDNVEYMLKTNFDNFPKGEPFSAILGDFLGRGIFNVDGDSWRFQRKMASLELGRASTRDYAFEVVHQVVNVHLIPALMGSAAAASSSSSSLKEDDDGEGNEAVIIDLQDLLRRFSFDAMCRFSFGLDPKCLELSQPLSEFAVSFDLASRLSAERALVVSPLVWKMKRLFNVGSERKLRESVSMIHELAQEVIRQRQKRAAADGGGGFSSSSDQRDLLSRFMVNTEDETYLRDIIISFLLAGRDTVASALTSLFWLVAKHRHVEGLIISEADRVLGIDREPASCEQLKGLHYLHAVVYESMRLYPPIQFDSKFCRDDDVLPDGSSVKKGCRVTYHPYAMGRMEEIWGLDCLEFKPERWLRDGVFAHDDRRAANFRYYPVFQGGPRVCLGKEMALVELKSVVVSVLRRFRFDLVNDRLEEGGAPVFSPGLTATFRGGLGVVVRVRGAAARS